MSRWEELMKQPKAKRITVHNQLDDIDTRGKKFLISDRVTPSFDSFVTDVNEKLAPPGVALRKIYTAQNGHPVRSVSALTVSKEYTASPRRFDKNRAEKLQSQSKNPSKKSSAASSEGYHSDDGGRGRVNSNSKRLAGHRMTLLERQKLYAKPRSHSEGASPAQSRSVSPAKKPPARTVRKPKTPVKRKPISKPPKKKTGRPLTFNERGKKRLEEKFPDDDSDDSRIPTPPGKRRVAFRGQYIFVTDDDEEDSDGGKSKAASKTTTAKSRKSTRTISKSPSKYSARSRISEEDEEDYYSDDEDDYKRSTVTKKSTKTTKFGDSYNHLTPNRTPSRFSSKSNKSTKSSKSRKSKSRQSTGSRRSADSGRNTGSESDGDYSTSRGVSGKSKQTTRNASAVSDRSEDSDEDRAASRISKYSKYSQLSRRGSTKSDSGEEYYDNDYNDKSSVKSRKGASASSRKSSGGSQGSGYSYQASRKQSGVRSVADSAETKVNTPVDLTAASQVEESDEYYYSDDEYNKSSASKRK